LEWQLLEVLRLGWVEEVQLVVFNSFAKEST